MALAVAGLISSGPAASAADTERIGGSDRIDTAIKIFEQNRSAFTSDTAVLTRGDDFADALTATPLAAAYKAPILTTSSTRLDGRVLAALRTQDIKRVFVIGGEGVLRPQVLAALRAAGIDAERVAGDDRYETARLIASQVMKARGVQATPVFLATGDNFPDALAAGTAAGASHGVVMLSHDTKLDATTRDFLRSDKAGAVTAVGGPAAAAARTATSSIRVIVGANRYDTAAMLAKITFTNPTTSIIASGETFADCLSGGALAALRGGPLLLTPAATLAAETEAYLQEVEVTAVVLGGPSAISQDVLNRIAAIVRLRAAPPSGGAGGAGAQTTSVTPAAPTFMDEDGADDDWVEIPVTTGVEYYVGEARAAAGRNNVEDHPTTTKTVTITARPSSSSYTLTGTTSWTRTFKTTRNILIRAEEIEFVDGALGADSTVTVPETGHVTWRIKDRPDLTPANRVFTIPEDTASITVVATADDGFTINGDHRFSDEFSHSFDSTNNASLSAPQWRDEAGKSQDKVTLTRADGVIYRVTINDEAPFETTDPEFNPWGAGLTRTSADVSVAVRAAAGYRLPANVGPWSHSFTAAVTPAPLSSFDKVDSPGQDGDRITIPATEGVIYRLNTSSTPNPPLQPGTYNPWTEKYADDSIGPGHGNVNIIAEPDTAHGYSNGGDADGYHTEGDGTWSITISTYSG